MAEVVTMPKLGFDMAEGQLVRWAIAEGESVEKGALLAEIETDKATVEVESMYTGVVHKHIVKEGAIVPVNSPIAVIGEAGEDIDLAALVGESASEETPAAAKESAPTASPDTAPAPVVDTLIDGNLPGGVRATPLARRIAEDRGIDLTTISGSGANGRIVKKDVENVPTQMTAAPVAATPAQYRCPIRSLSAGSECHRRSTGRQTPAALQTAPDHRPPHGRFQAELPRLLRHL